MQNVAKIRTRADEVIWSWNLPFAYMHRNKIYSHLGKKQFFPYLLHLQLLWGLWEIEIKKNYQGSFTLIYLNRYLCVCLSFWPFNYMWVTPFTWQKRIFQRGYLISVLLICKVIFIFARALLIGKHAQNTLFWVDLFPEADKEEISYLIPRFVAGDSTGILYGKARWVLHSRDVGEAEVVVVVIPGLALKRLRLTSSGRPPT